jgi:hypothetical protein
MAVLQAPQAGSLIDANLFARPYVRRGVTKGAAMAAYKCDKCDMSIGTMTCGHCGKELQHSTLTKADGTSVHVSQCPDGHGKVKSPMCCGQDMTCSV